VSSWATNCLNCGAPLYGHFCGSCGQRAVPPNPTVRELAAEAVGEFVGWDGKLVETARLLITRPGALTCEMLAGHRARYISPLRLYLTCSVAFFLLAASIPNVGQTYVGLRPTPGVGKISTRAGASAQMTPAEKAELLEQAKAAPALLRPLIRRAAADPTKLQHDVFEAMPRALFVVLPAFAGILMLFYRRRNFPEHLYFALHLHAFVFLALALNEAVKLTRSTALSVTVGIAVILMIPVYAHLAFRRVYGDSHLKTFAKELGIAVLYSAVWVPAIVGVALWVARG
jgi:hypothetical protein